MRQLICKMIKSAGQGECGGSCTFDQLGFPTDVEIVGIWTILFPPPSPSPIFPISFPSALPQSVAAVVVLGILPFFYAFKPLCSKNSHVFVHIPNKAFPFPSGHDQNKSMSETNYAVHGILLQISILEGYLMIAVTTESIQAEQILATGRANFYQFGVFLPILTQ